MIMSIHLERLQTDFEALQALAGQSSKLEIAAAEGNPPNEYLLTVKCPGMIGLKDGKPEISEKHLVSISLPRKYPFERPKIVFKTPIFHPHVFPNGIVCLGVVWKPTRKLDEIVCRIIEFVQFAHTAVNERDPANFGANNWYQANKDFLPIDSTPIKDL